MDTPSVLPPAPFLAKTQADLFAQLGATKVEASDSTSLHLTFTDNAKAANADALLKDVVRGAKVIVDNKSGIREPIIPSADGIADVLRGVQGLEVYEIVGEGSAPTEVIGVTFDPQLQAALSLVVDRTPVKGVTVDVPKG